MPAGKKWHFAPSCAVFFHFCQKLTCPPDGCRIRYGLALTRFAGGGAILYVFALPVRRLPESVYFSGTGGFVAWAAAIVFTNSHDPIPVPQ